MKNRNRYLAIVLALVLACSVSCKKTDNGPDTDAKENQGVQTTLSDTETSGNEPASDEISTDNITDTEKQTEAQTEEDTTPAVTEPDSDTEEITEDIEPVVDDPAPTEPDEGEDDTTSTEPEDEIEVPVGTERSGSFVSEEHPHLQLVVDWDYVILSDGMAQVTLDVGLSHYRLFSQKKIGMGTFSVDGVSTHFNTEAIAHDENTKTVTPFFTEIVTTPLDEMEISVEWIVLGTYGGVEIDSLTVEGTIVFEQ